MRNRMAEAHAPKSSLGVILDEVRVALLRKWMDSPSAGAAFVTAHVGAGLSTLIRLLVKELRLEVTWIHAGTKNVSELLEDAGSSSTAVNGRRKIIVVDEFDSVSTDKRMMTAVTDYVKSQGKTKILCAGHPSRSSKASEFAAKWERIDFPRLSTKKLEATLRAAGFDPEAARDAAAKSKGDLRAAFNSMELPSVASAKDDFLEGLDGVDVVLGTDPLTVREALVTYAFDASVVPMGVFENYLGCLSGSDCDIASRVSDAFSVADVVDDAMYATQNWDLTEVHGTFSAATPALELRRRTAGGECRVEKFGTVWSRIYNSKAKEKNVRAINSKRMESGLQPMKVEDLSYQRGMIRDALGRSTDEDVLRACGGLSDDEVLLLMRLGFSAYKHARIKKLFRS